VALDRDRIIFRAALRHVLDLIDIYKRKNDWDGLAREINKLIERQDEELDVIVVSALIK